MIVLQSRGIINADMDPLPRQLALSPRFQNLYRDFGAIRFDWFHDRSYWIYVLKDMKFDEDQLEKLPKGVGSVQRINR